MAISPTNATLRLA